MYEKILKAAIEFEKRAQMGAIPEGNGKPNTLPGGIGAYQDLLSGYKAWSKFTKGKNLIGVDVDSKQLIPDNQTIQYILKLMDSKAGKVNIGLAVNQNGSIAFNINGNHPAIPNIKNMLHKNLAPAMQEAINAAVAAKAISLPSSAAPVNWNWINGLEVV